MTAATPYQRDLLSCGLDVRLEKKRGVRRYTKQILAHTVCMMAQPEHLSEHEQLIIRALNAIWPDWVTNADLKRRASISTHQAVFAATRALAEAGLIAREQRNGREWYFQALSGTPVAVPAGDSGVPATHPSDTGRSNLAREFEAKACGALQERFRCQLVSRCVPGVPKCFDFVSEDGEIIGDAKFYDMVRGSGLPPAKFSIIAEHVWLLERTSARHVFLIFGNNRDVPLRWLRKYGHLVQRVVFFFLDPSGQLESLNVTSPRAR